MKQFVHLRASPRVGMDMKAFSEAMSCAFPGRVRKYHASVVRPDGPWEYWRSEYAQVTDGCPERLIADYARRYLGIRESLGDISQVDMSFVIVTEVVGMSDMTGYYLPREALQLLVAAGWDVDIDVVPDVGEGS